jgi:hypothetical protein
MYVGIAVTCPCDSTDRTQINTVQSNKRTINRSCLPPISPLYFMFLYQSLSLNSVQASLQTTHATSQLS